MDSASSPQVANCSSRRLPCSSSMPSSSISRTMHRPAISAARLPSVTERAISASIAETVWVAVSFSVQRAAYSVQPRISGLRFASRTADRKVLIWRKGGRRSLSAFCGADGRILIKKDCQNGESYDLQLPKVVRNSKTK